MRQDPGYKLLFSHARMVEDLLRSFVPEPWVNGLDFSTLERVSASAVADDLRERHNDIVWRVCWGDSEGGQRWLYVYLMLEFQSTVDSWMPVRVLTYVGLLYQDLIRQKLVQAGERLPPVVPILLYNGDRPWSAACDLEPLLEPVAGFDAYRPRIRYLLLDEQHLDEQALVGAQGLVQALFQLERSRSPQAMSEVLAALTAWLDAPGNAELRRAFTEFLRQVLLPARLPGIELPALNDLSEIRVMLSERIKEWTEQWKQQGLAEGLEQGRAEGLEQGLEQGLQKGLQKGLEQGHRREAELILRQLRRRVGDVPAAMAEPIRAMPPERLEALGEALLDFSSLDELRIWLEQW